MSLFLKLLGDTNKSINNGIRLTAQMALGKEGDSKYFEPTEFVNYINSLRGQELRQAEEVILLMKAETCTTGTYLKKTDKGKREYGYLNFVKAKGTLGFKIILECNMAKFIDDYIDGVFSVDFTLEELYNEAVSA